MKVSVVACTYNGEAYVAEQLNTLLMQRRIPDEIIIGDDASSDGTWAHVVVFAAKARSRGIEVKASRYTERLGYVGNFSRCLALATGDLIFLCDQDDAWHADKIDAMTSLLKGDAGVTFAHTDARLVDAQGGDLGHSLFEALELSRRERQRIATGDAFSVYLRRNLATGAASVFRRSLLEVALPLPSDWVHDAWLATLAAAMGRVAIIDDALIDYRQHGANQIGMARRTPKQRLTDMFIQRNESLRKDAERMDVLIDRLTRHGAPVVNIATTREMREHLLLRSRIGTQPFWHRIPSVMREWSTGRYTRFGTGIRSALRDLLRVG